MCDLTCLYIYWRLYFLQTKYSTNNIITDNERGRFAQKYLSEMRIQIGYVLRVSGELHDDRYCVKKLRRQFEAPRCIGKPGKSKCLN